MDTSILLDVGLMDGKYSVPPEDPPPPLLANECLDSAAIEYLDASVAETMDSLVTESRARMLREEADCNALQACPAAFAVRKPSKKNDCFFMHSSTGHVNEFLIRETAKQQGVRLAVALLLCVGFLEANGRKAPVPGLGVIHAAMLFGRFHIDLCGPCKPALDRSIYMAMFVDSTSQW